MTFTIPQHLDHICQKINTDGFYLGFYAQEDFAIRPTYIKEEVSFKYDNILNKPFEVTNPYLESTILYKVDTGLFKAFPIHYDTKMFERFFIPSYASAKLSGIVIVSHKLKMLSFLWACYDPIDQDDEYLALWFNLERAAQWAFLVRFLDESRSVPIFHPNALHSNYGSAFACRRSSSIYPWELCLNIEDHWKNELLYDKVCMCNEIDQYKSSISSAKSIIASQEKKILEFNNKIENRIQNFEKYKTDIYKFRVDAELQNVN